MTESKNPNPNPESDKSKDSSANPSAEDLKKFEEQMHEDSEVGAAFEDMLKRMMDGLQ